MSADDEEMAEELRLAAGDESQVGKQLTDLSTRRVIILVLFMMFQLQFVGVEEDPTFLSSAFYGVEQVYDSWREYNSACARRSNIAEDSEVLHFRETYETDLLE